MDGSLRGTLLVVHTSRLRLRGVPSLHASEYRRPDLLPDGGVLVVGAGASGQQLALELRAAGRDVVLSAGRHSRSHRTYRGRDVFEWLQLLGDFDRTIDELPDLEAAKRVPPFPLSGANGGEDLGLDLLDSVGVRMVGRLASFDGSRAVFAGDLEENVAKADGRLEKLLRGSTRIRWPRGPPSSRSLPSPFAPTRNRSTHASSERSSGRQATAVPTRGSTSPAHSTAAASFSSGRAAHVFRGSTFSGSRTSTGAAPISSAASVETPSSSRARSLPGHAP